MDDEDTDVDHDNIDVDDEDTDVDDDDIDVDDEDNDDIKVWERSFLITHAEGFVIKGELQLVKKVLSTHCTHRSTFQVQC